MNKESNVTLIAVPQKSKSCFHIYLDFSGQREYLMYHRYDPCIYSLLKSGMRMSEVQRWKVCRSHRRRGGSVKLDNSIRHILHCARDYLADRQSA